MRVSFLCLPLLYIALLSSQTIQALLVNVTIDDKFGDPRTGAIITYTPREAWNDGTNCPGCTAHPDPSMTFKDSWTDSTFNVQPGSNNFPNTVLSASVSFNGTAVYAFCILAKTTTSPAGNSDMTFLIDGNIAGTFVKPAPGTGGFDYHVLVFSTTSLSPGNHTLTLQNGHVNGSKSLVILDSIVYSFDDGTPSAVQSQDPASSTTAVETSPLSAPLSFPSSTPSSGTSSPTTKSSTPVIVGAVLGSIGGVSLFALIFFLLRQRSTASSGSVVREIQPDPFPISIPVSRPGHDTFLSQASFNPYAGFTQSPPSTAHPSSTNSRAYASAPGEEAYDPFITASRTQSSHRYTHSKSTDRSALLSLGLGVAGNHTATASSSGSSAIVQPADSATDVPDEAPPSYELSQSHSSSAPLPAQRKPRRHQ